MAVFCPYKADVVLYLECQECKTKAIAVLITYLRF